MVGVGGTQQEKKLAVQMLRPFGKRRAPQQSNPLPRTLGT